MTDSVRTGPALRAVQQHLVSPAQPVVGRVVSNELCTAGGTKAAGYVRHVAIDVSGTPLAGSFVSGQSFGVVPPGEDHRGKRHKLRLYSLSCPTAGEDGSGNVISTTVKRTIDEHWDTHKLFLGVCSNYLCDLAEGDEVTLTGPAGKRFVLPQDPAAHDYIFIATGTGIAPFRGMLGDLAHTPGVRTALVMGAPYHTDLLYDDDLRARAERDPDFRYAPVLSRETNPNAAHGYVQDLLAGDDALLDMLRNGRTLVYICGIAGMELGIFRAMADALDEATLAEYLTIDPEIRDEPAGWTRRMIPRKIKPTPRVFLEVY